MIIALKNTKIRTHPLYSLLPFPILSYLPVSTLNIFSTKPIIGLIFVHGETFLADVLYLFIILSILIYLTGNKPAVSFKKILLISVLVAVTSLLYNLLFVIILLNSGLSKTFSQFAASIPFYSYLTIFIIPSLITLSALIISLRKLSIRMSFLISLITTLLTVQWFLLPISISANRVENQRNKIENAGSEVIGKISHQIMGEELINDLNPRYKLLRINIKVSVPETAVYKFYADLTNKANGKIALISYVNGKDQVDAVELNLNKGENIVYFDFPYVYLEDNGKREAINLHYNDEPTGNYGPYNLRFTIYLTKAGNFDTSEAQSAYVGLEKIIYGPKTYETTKIYSYKDFYQ